MNPALAAAWRVMVVRDRNWKLWAYWLREWAPRITERETT